MVGGKGRTIAVKILNMATLERKNFVPLEGSGYVGSTAFEAWRDKRNDTIKSLDLNQVRFVRDDLVIPDGPRIYHGNNGPYGYHKLRPTDYTLLDANWFYLLMGNTNLISDSWIRQGLTTIYFGGSIFRSPKSHLDSMLGIVYGFNYHRMYEWQWVRSNLRLMNGKHSFAVV